MLEYQGWVTIRESYNESQESEELLANIWNQLHEKLSILERDEHNRFIKLKIFNGEKKLLVCGCSNHKDSRWAEVLDLYQWISKNAVGSYGLLHFFDDEDNDGLNNQFQVYVLKKGNLIKVVDPFLSPFISELED